MARASSPVSYILLAFGQVDVLIIYSGQGRKIIVTGEDARDSLTLLEFLLKLNGCGARPTGPAP